MYSDSFFIPMLETKIPEKTREFWLHKRDEMPPSVVLIGLDALSRMNYYRFLPQTKEFMDSHGAVELMGYTKGEKKEFTNFLVIRNIRKYVVPALSSSWRKYFPKRCRLFIRIGPF